MPSVSGSTAAIDTDTVRLPCTVRRQGDEPNEWTIIISLNLNCYIFYGQLILCFSVSIAIFYILRHQTHGTKSSRPDD